MCGRFNLVTTTDLITETFDVVDSPEIAPRYNIAPTQPIAAIRLNARQQRELTHFSWGLVPSWAKDPKMASRMINARSETVAEKPSFRAAFKRRRCLIPVTGFYEWQKIGDIKQPMHIHPADGSVWAFAGLWEHWVGPYGSEIESCTMLTTAANDLISPVHHRMPVRLEADDFELWLDPFAPLPAVSAVLGVGFSAENTTLTPIHSYVNSPRNESPQCIVPLNT